MSQVDALSRQMGDQGAEAGTRKYPNVLAWFLAALLLYLALSHGGSVAIFINAPSLVIVLGVSCFLGIAAYGLRDFSYGMSALLCVYRKRVPSSLGAKHANIIRSMRTYVVFSGVMGFFVGLIQMLANLNDPSSIGPAVAVALLTIFYSILLILFILQPALSYLENHLLEGRADEERPEIA